MQIAPLKVGDIVQLTSSFLADHAKLSVRGMVYDKYDTAKIAFIGGRGRAWIVWVSPISTHKDTWIHLNSIELYGTPR